VLCFRVLPRTSLASSAHHSTCNSSEFSSLQPLELSCPSFRSSLPLFSAACSLFVQNTGGGVSRMQLRDAGGGVCPARTKRFRQNIDLLLLCFQVLANPFSRKRFVCTSIQNPGGVRPCPSFQSLCLGASVANLPPQFSFSPIAWYRPHQSGGFSKCQ
jgi:hypothetical protein